MPHEIREWHEKPAQQQLWCRTFECGQKACTVRAMVHGLFGQPRKGSKYMSLHFLVHLLPCFGGTGGYAISSCSTKANILICFKNT